MIKEPLLPKTSFSMPDLKVWYVVGEGRKGRFFHTLSAAKGFTSHFRPMFSVALVEYDLTNGTTSVLMDWKAGTCEWCGGDAVNYNAHFARATAQFDADVICGKCYFSESEQPW